MNKPASKDKNADVFMHPSEKNRILLEQLSKCALDLHYEGKLTEAVVCYEHILELKPEYARIHNNMAVALKTLGQPEKAIEHYKKAIEIAPNYPEAYNNMGNAYRVMEKREEAIESYKKAMELKQDYAEAHYNLGNVLKDMGRMEAAIEEYHIGLGIKPDYPEALNDMGIAYQGIGDVTQAIEYYKKSLALKPDYAEAHNNMGAAHQMLGQKDKAIAGYREALRLKPDYAAACRQMAMVAPEETDVEAIEKFLQQPDIEDDRALHLHFALGEVFNSQKDYIKAFEHFQKGNDIKYRMLPYEQKKHTNMVNRIIKTYTAKVIKEKSQFGKDTRQPVFIVGMPRSGTTLVEQILSSHPEVYGAGELAHMTTVQREMRKTLDTETPYPECAGELNEAEVKELAELYLTKTLTLADDTRHITDKMPDNFLRVGLIKMLFPNAGIIHCKRNPMDIGTSIYLRLFTSKLHSYSYNLKALAAYYKDYERLMEHWKAIFGDQILEVQYEDVVADQEAHTRRMLEFVGLDWDDNCLNFHENERAVMTASNQQVRQPIYRHSVDRWKRYGDGMQPLADLLAT